MNINMTSIVNIIKQYKDKIQHLIVSAGLVVIGYYLFNLQTGLFIGISFGLLKELWDSTKKDNRWDWWDLLADLIGIVIGVWICLL